MVCGLDIVWGTRGDRAGIKSTKGKQKGKGGRQTPCSATHTSYGKPVWSLVFMINLVSIIEFNEYCGEMFGFRI